MTSLKAEPPGPVRSLDEFFAVAHAMESDAVARYCDTARLLRQQHADALATCLRGLAQTERGHVDQVNAWAAHRDASPPTTTALPWAVPDTHDAPPDEIAQSRLLTPYQRPGLGGAPRRAGLRLLDLRIGARRPVRREGGGRAHGTRRIGACFHPAPRTAQGVPYRAQDIGPARPTRRFKLASFS